MALTGGGVRLYPPPCWTAPGCTATRGLTGRGVGKLVLMTSPSVYIVMYAPLGIPGSGHKLS